MSITPVTLTYRSPHLALDLWRPVGPARRLVVHAHGGGFVHGSRDDRIARFYGPLLAEKGIAFASISYRKGGAPRRAFDAEMLEKIETAAARSQAFYPDVRPSLLGVHLYRAAVDFADAAHFLLTDEGVGLAELPWIAMGNSSGGLAAMAAAYGLSHWSRDATLPSPRRVVAIASIVPQPWRLTPEGPEAALLCARGDAVFPRGQVDRLVDYVEQDSLPVTFNRIPFGQHTRPVREVLPDDTGEIGQYGRWLLDQIEGGAGALAP